MADYWGINLIHPKINDDKGISLVIINSNKGQELFENIKEKIIFVDTNLDEAIKYNSAMLKSACRSKNEIEFFNHLDDTDFDILVNKNIPKKSSINKIVSKIKNKIKKVFK